MGLWQTVALSFCICDNHPLICSSKYRFRFELSLYLKEGSRPVWSLLAALPLLRGSRSIVYLNWVTNNPKESSYKQSSELNIRLSILSFSSTFFKKPTRNRWLRARFEKKPKSFQQGSQLYCGRVSICIVLSFLIESVSRCWLTLLSTFWCVARIFSIIFRSDLR